jgi:hypothetical protein
VNDEASKLAFESGLRLQKLQAEHLRVDSHGVGTVEASVDRLVDERARGGRLLAQGPDGVLKHASLSLEHGRILGRTPDAWPNHFPFAQVKRQVRMGSSITSFVADSTSTQSLV